MTFATPTTITRLTLGILLLALLLVMMLAGTASPTVLLALATELPTLALWLTAAYAYGHLATIPWHELPADEQTRSSSSDLRAFAKEGLPSASWLVFSSKTALGLGIISLLTLAAGSLGILTQLTAYLILLPGAAFSLYLVYQNQTALSAAIRAPAGPFTALLPLAVPLGLLTFACLFPPLMLWGDDPHPYDVLSYHFQLPREFLATGSTAPLKHNVFSHFPLLAEMHFALMFALRGGPYAGMYTAQFTSAAHAILAAIAIFGLARTLLPAKAAVAALLAAATCPFLLMLGSVGYVESHLLLYTALTLAFVTQALITPVAGRHRTLMLCITAGLFAGFAASSKLTAIPLLLVILPLSLLPILRQRIVSLALPIAAYLLTALLVLSPWLVRTYAATANPIFPLATNILGQAHFTPEQTDRWQAAHTARTDQQTLQARAKALYTDLLANDRFAFLLVPLALVGAALTLRRSAILQWLALFALLHVGFWLYFTHLQGRFLITLLPVLCLFVAATVNTTHLSRILLLIARAALYATGTAILFTRLAHPIAQAWQAPILYTPTLTWATPELLAAYDPQAPLLLVGDIRPFLFDRPNLFYATVFDLPAGEITQSLRASRAPLPPGTLELISPSELSRLANTYRHLTFRPDTPLTPAYIQPTPQP